MLTLSAIYQYPVKSLAGIALRSAVLDDFGLSGDRRWMVVDGNGKFLTQRKLSQMACFRVSEVPDGIRLSLADKGHLDIPKPVAGAPAVQVAVWGDSVAALDAGDEAAKFLHHLLPEDARLVFMPDSTFRRVDATWVPDERRVSFADGFPLLLFSQASVAEISNRLPTPVTERNFRPNLVIAGAEAFAEDGWRRLRIGDLEFECVKPCSRCVMTTVDPDTGIRRPDGEPFRTLSGYRRTEHGVIFGQNVMHKGQGEIRVGDRVEILD